LGGAIGLDWDCEVVVGAVDAEDAVDLEFEGALGGDLAFGMVGDEDDFRVRFCFEDFFVHAAVPRLVAGFAGGCVDYDFAGGFSCRWVECEISVLEGEGAVDVVGVAGQEEIDLGVLAVEFERELLGAERSGETCREDDEGDWERVSLRVSLCTTLQVTPYATSHATLHSTSRASSHAASRNS
jgi:hypothetical protein